MGPASRHGRVLAWLAVGTGLSILIQFLPAWFNTDPDLGPARIFGSREILLTGMLVLLGALVDWYCSDLTGIKRGVFTFFTVMPATILVVDGCAYAQLTEGAGHTPSEGVVVGVSVLFGVSVLLGTLVTWIEK